MVHVDADAIAKGLLDIFSDHEEGLVSLRFGMIHMDWIAPLQHALGAKFDTLTSQQYDIPVDELLSTFKKFDAEMAAVGVISNAATTYHKERQKFISSCETLVCTALYRHCPGGMVV